MPLPVAGSGTSTDPVAARAQAPWQVALCSKAVGATFSWVRVAGWWYKILCCPLGMV